MELEVNGEPETLETEQLTVDELLEEFDVDMPDQVTVELNGEVISRDEYGEQQVTAGDSVEFLYFMGGGQLGPRR